MGHSVIVAPRWQMLNVTSWKELDVMHLNLPLFEEHQLVIYQNRRGNGIR
jgi:hypothetical protein